VTPYLILGEHIEGSYTVKETQRKEIMGQLQLSNYKIIFKKNGAAMQECCHSMVPYGYIQKIQEYKSSAEMSDCFIAITCKDERVFKFRFQQTPQAFENAAKIIKNYALKSDLKSLSCYLRPKETNKFELQKLISKQTTTDWSQIAETTALDLARMCIPDRFRPINFMLPKQPGPMYVLPEVNDD